MTALITIKLSIKSSKEGLRERKNQLNISVYCVGKIKKLFQTAEAHNFFYFYFLIAIKKIHQVHKQTTQ